MDEPYPIKVLIRNEDGLYLAGDARHWEFTSDRERARVFDYLRDRVAEQLDLIQNAYGSAWAAVRADPREAYEVCDRCGRRIVSFKTFFDGKQFLCAECHRAAAGAEGRTEPGKEPST